MQPSDCKSPKTHLVLDLEDRENTGEDSPRVPLADKKIGSEFDHRYSSKYKEVVERTIVRMDSEKKVERAHQRLIAEREKKDQYRSVTGGQLCHFLESLYIGSDLDSMEGICRRLLLVRLGDLDDQPPSDEVEKAQKMLWKEALQLMVKYEL